MEEVSPAASILASARTFCSIDKVNVSTVQPLDRTAYASVSNRPQRKRLTHLNSQTSPSTTNF